MSEFVWVENVPMEDSFQEMYKIDTEITQRIPIIRNFNLVKIRFSGKEFVITEEMNKGLTKMVTVEHDGDVLGFESVKKAELYIAEKLRT